jgi:hypothetical protein
MQHLETPLCIQLFILSPALLSIIEEIIVCFLELVCELAEFSLT